MSVNFAWVSLVMGGDAYVPGAIALATSLLETGSVHTRVCMVTNDVSDRSVQELGKVFDLILTVDYVQAGKIYTRRSDKRHTAEFLRNILTRWRCLTLTQFSKIVYVDIDVIFIQNPDRIFTLTAPAGTLEHPWSNQKNQYYFAYGELTHGSVHQQQKLLQVARTRRGGFVSWGSLLVLEPSLSTFREIIRLRDNQYCAQTKYRSCLSRYDELIIVDAHPKNTMWTHIDPRYHFVSWKSEPITQPIVGIHFRGTPKTWERQEVGCYSDEQAFWDIYHIAVEKYNITLLPKTANEASYEASYHDRADCCVSLFSDNSLEEKTPSYSRDRRVMR